MSGALDVTGVIPFDDIIPNASARWISIDGIQYLSVRDMIMSVCQKNTDYAGQVWRNLSGEKKDELSPYLNQYQFPGPGQWIQPVITFPGALKLIMFLPGETAKKHRSAMAVKLQRYYAGDESLVDEIRANASSSGSVQQMARASLDCIDETEKCIKRARASLQEIVEESSAFYGNVQGAVSGMERIVELKKEMLSLDQNDMALKEKMYSLDQNDRVQQREHVIAMAHAQVQAMQILAQARMALCKKDPEIVFCKGWLLEYLREKGITHPEICESIWIRLQYRLKKHHPNIQIIRKKGLLHFSTSDLEAVQAIIDQGISHLGWPTARPQNV